jgi:hypothetical protein
MMMQNAEEETNLLCLCLDRAHMSLAALTRLLNLQDKHSVEPTMWLSDGCMRRPSCIGRKVKEVIICRVIWE